MSKMDRREFIGRAAAVLATALGDRALGTEQTRPTATTVPTTQSVLRANDVITLGKTGIKTSRLSIGTGTKGGGEQRKVGIEGMVKLFRHALDQGICWWDTADAYKMHPFVRAALKEVKRDQVTITSKTRATDADGMRADMERFRKELNTDYIDIVLLHCMQSSNWPEQMKGPMDALHEAKQKGLARTVGCSYHTLGALEAAANEPWVEVSLVRYNPFAILMDVEKANQVAQVTSVLETMHKGGKVVYGMKILGEGRIEEHERINESLRFALSKRFMSGFTIGFVSEKQIDDVISRIDRLGVRA